MKTEHTQGPWQSVGNRVEKHGKEGFYSRICICTEATLCDEHGGTSSANARLIAAAPDMLAASVNALALLAQIDAICINGKQPAFGVIRELARDAAGPMRAAIANAKGGSK